MGLLSSTAGVFLVQTVAHSLLALSLVEASLKVWHIRAAYERFRFRLLVLILPPLMFPAFQLFNSDRGSFYFTQDRALFNTRSWLQIDLWGEIPLGFLFFLSLTAVAVLTLGQELIPVLRSQRSRKGRRLVGQPDELASELDRMTAALSLRYQIEKPSLEILADTLPILVVDGVRQPKIYISVSLLGKLGPEELKSAMAHELAHIVRRSTATTLVVFLLRMLMFYNPISLLVFRRLIQDDEQVCDDLTVSVTGNPQALASALEAFYLEMPSGNHFSLAGFRKTLEHSSHNLLLRERVARFKEGRHSAPSGFHWIPFFLTLVSVLAVCYRVV